MRAALLVPLALLLAGCADQGPGYPDAFLGGNVEVEGTHVGSMDEPDVAALAGLLEMDSNPGEVDIEALCTTGCPEPRPREAHGTILARDEGGIAAVVLAMRHDDPEAATEAISGRAVSEGEQALLRDGDIVISVQVDDDVPELLDRIVERLERATDARRVPE